MLELRLVDPDGYDAVTDGYKVTVPAEQAATEADHLKAEVAPAHAAEHAYARYDVRDYRVQTTPLASRNQPPSRSAEGTMTRSTVVNDLHNLADILDADLKRYGMCWPVGGMELMRACFGDLLTWSDQKGRYELSRDYWRVPGAKDAAKARIDAVCDALGSWNPNRPDKHSRTRYRPSEVREVADRIQAQETRAA